MAEKTGVLDPDRMYSTAALQRVGIGRVNLTEARKAGVQPHIVGTEHWYQGGEIIEWIKSQRRKGQRQPSTNREAVDV